MAKKAKTVEINPAVPQTDPNVPISLSALLSTKTIFHAYRLWIVGSTPLIVHSWSTKAKTEMLQKQVGAVRGGKEKRNPEQDFIDSLYSMGKDDSGNEMFGFPATGVKNCILAAAHKDKGVARSAVMAALWVDAEMIRVRPALAGAICDMPLIRIHGAEPQMREDMTKIGAGLNKVANLAYRGQFWPWAMRITGRFNASVISAEQLAFLIQESGLASGLGEWRNERKGVFGSFHLATATEEAEWEAYASGNGPLPVDETMKMAAE